MRYMSRASDSIADHMPLPNNVPNALYPPCTRNRACEAATTRRPGHCALERREAQHKHRCALPYPYGRRLLRHPASSSLLPVARGDCGRSGQRRWPSASSAAVYATHAPTDGWMAGQSPCPYRPQIALAASTDSPSRSRVSLTRCWRIRLHSSLSSRSFIWGKPNLTSSFDSSPCMRFVGEVAMCGLSRSSNVTASMLLSTFLSACTSCSRPRWLSEKARK
mmetsp:Transcript_67832/g.151495  ORF Transcript_67832/g.151495 Transcript_67832/m.151495 type:complete len:221 (+) Transcript_67832:509-1171(+)